MTSASSTPSGRHRTVDAFPRRPVPDAGDPAVREPIPLTVYGISEAEPGPRWQALFAATWPGYRRWYLQRDVRHRPDLATARDRLERHMPELVPTYDAMVELALGSDAATGDGPVLLLLGLAIIVALGQVVLLIVRGGVLVVLAGLWPLSASAAALDAGRAWFSTQTGWIVAFALYKPTAATIYAASFYLMGAPSADADATLTVLSGVAVMAVSVLALPALVRLIVPFTTPVSGGRGFGSVAGGATALLVAARR